MIEIKCLNDIKALKEHLELPKQLVEYVAIDLNTVKEWSDYDNEYSLDTFNTDINNNGYIVILDGNETTEQLEQQIGLTGGLQATIPEAVNNLSFDGVKWSRVVVIYNDSYAMILWIPNYDGFDSYAFDEDCDAIA